jgi:hypothetical protein
MTWPAIRVLLPAQRGAVGPAGCRASKRVSKEGAAAQRSPGPRRPGDPLELPGPGILHREEIAEQPSRAAGSYCSSRNPRSHSAMSMCGPRFRERLTGDDATLLLELPAVAQLARCRVSRLQASNNRF